MDDITRSALPELLAALQSGDPAAVDRLYTELYGDLRRMAHDRLRRQPSLTLIDTTVLVHESYLRLVRSGAMPVAHEAKFLAYAARAMRSVIVDAIRERRALRRGDGAKVTLDGDVPGADPREDEILGVHAALEQLRAIDARLVQVVELRYFGGLNEDETARVLGVGVRTVSRDWEKARLYLAGALA